MVNVTLFLSGRKINKEYPFKHPVYLEFPPSSPSWLSINKISNMLKSFSWGFGNKPRQQLPTKSKQDSPTIYSINRHQSLA